MKLNLPLSFCLSQEVAYALDHHAPIVALESAVITHGLPQPENLTLALEMQRIIRSNGSIPATIALLEGKLLIGMDDAQLQSLAAKQDSIKVSSRNIGIGISEKKSGGTTVAATLFAARTAGISVFATGGIGGIHRGTRFDISADLDELQKSPVIVVCAGAKSILDLPATLEALETRGVPVLGYKTDNFPAFYSRNSDLPVDIQVESAQQIADIARAHWTAGLQSAILVGNPPDEEYAIDYAEIEKVIEEAVDEASMRQISGTKLTPFLLDHIRKLTGGKSMGTNLQLLKNNAKLAAQISVALSKPLTASC